MYWSICLLLASEMNSFNGIRSCLYQRRRSNQFEPIYLSIDGNTEHTGQKNVTGAESPNIRSPDHFTCLSTLVTELSSVAREIKSTAWNVRLLSGSVQPPKWSRPRNDPQPWNDPQIDHEMIPTPKWSPFFFLSTPKWSPKELENGDQTWDCGLLNY